MILLVPNTLKGATMTFAHARRIPALAIGLMIASLNNPLAAETPSYGPAADPGKVRQVQAGELKEANAAWFGFDPADSTEAIQAAIDSGAPRVIIPNVGADWIVRPIKLRSDQEIVFEDGATVAAKPGEFLGKFDCLFSAVNQRNVALRGKGTLRMRKADYAAGGPYVKAEWRMTLALYSCENVVIDGLTFADSGGDGIYLGVNKADGSLPYCKNVTIRNVVCDNNYRQGISVISAVDLLIEDSVFRNTGGTAPSAGLDFEPNRAGQSLKNVTVRRCVAENNAGPGFIAYLRKLTAQDQVSVLVEDCRVRGGDMGLVVGASTDGGSRGSITFRNCTVEGTNRAGAYVYDKAADGTAVRFENCTWRNVAISPGDASDNPAEPDSAKNVPLPNVPVLIYLRR